jgi:RNA:NAD 2'-phosphotransferase (TPT1/KptA family)
MKLLAQLSVVCTLLSASWTQSFSAHAFDAQSDIPQKNSDEIRLKLSSVLSKPCRHPSENGELTLKECGYWDTSWKIAPSFNGW